MIFRAEIKGYELSEVPSSFAVHRRFRSPAGRRSGPPGWPMHAVFWANPQNRAPRGSVLSWRRVDFFQVHFRIARQTRGSPVELPVGNYSAKGHAARTTIISTRDRDRAAVGNRATK